MSAASFIKGSALALLVLALTARAEAPTSPGKPLTLAAAASLRKVLPALAEAFRKKEGGGAEISASYGASGDMKKQVERGAPVDLVLFASTTPVDALETSGHLVAGTKRIVARNTLVLIGPKGHPKLTFQTLPKLPEKERIAIGEPGAVPAGAYAKTALEALGHWDAIKSRIVYGADVGQVLSYVKRGEVGAGVVYGTEVLGIDAVEQWEVAQGAWAPKPVVVAAIVKKSADEKRAAAFLGFLTSPEATRVWASFGFASSGFSAP